MGKKQSKMPDYVQVNLEQKTKFKKNQLIRYHKSFERYEEGITVEQLRSDYQTEYDNCPRFCEMLFHGNDDNKDGRLDFEQFMLMLSVLKHNNQKQKLTLAFKLYDADENGFLVKNELLEILHSANPSEGEGDTNLMRVTKLFNQLDANGDGRLSVTEFVGAGDIEPMITRFVGEKPKD